MKCANPLVSVVMTSYNHERYLADAIDSILSQTFKDFELIIVDDGSTDHSQVVISQFHDPRIRAFSQENQGPSVAANRAVKLAAGKFVATHASDDKSAPNRLERQVAYLGEHPDVAIVGSFVYEINGRGELQLENAAYEGWFNQLIDFNQPESWIWQNRLCGPSLMLRKSLFDECGLYDPHLVYTQDWDMWIKAIVSSHKISVIPEKLIYYRSHEGNLTNKNPERAFWEYAYIFCKVLLPYLLNLERFDLIGEAVSVFLCHDCFRASSLEARANLLTKMISPEDTFSSFEVFMSSIQAPADDKALRLSRILDLLISKYLKQRAWNVELEQAKKWLDQQQNSWRIEAERRGRTIGRRIDEVISLFRMQQMTEERDRVLAERDRTIRERDEKLAILERELSAEADSRRSGSEGKGE